MTSQAIPHRGYRIFVLIMSLALLNYVEWSAIAYAGSSITIEYGFNRAQGEVPPLTQVVIETTGIAMPGPILATLLVDALIRSHYSFNATVTFVDAVNYPLRSERYPEWFSQVGVADRLIISKRDLIDDIEVESLHLKLAALNPAAEIFERDADPGSSALRSRPLDPSSLFNIVRCVGSLTAPRASTQAPLGRVVKALEHRAFQDTRTL